MAFTFTPEDGAGLATANAYITVAFANDYHTGRGHGDWGGSTGNKQKAIVRATDYVDKRFGAYFRGLRLAKRQALEWPRINAIDNDDWELRGPEDAVPRQLQRAVAEYALIALRLIAGTDADLAPEDGVTEGQVKSKSEKVTGPGGAGVSESTVYVGGGTSRASQSSVVSDASIPEYPAADLWLEELLKSSNARRLRRG
jgi:2,4-dienoyl-CoA reductase-like NADH-dependent reductase (Old Yellow Enzyme family)